ncbi:putative reverse transcriptase domain-containing protein [Tanacetum coccineum]
MEMKVTGEMEMEVTEEMVMEVTEEMEIEVTEEMGMEVTREMEMEGMEKMEMEKKFENGMNYGGFIPVNEIQKMETELWNLTMKGNYLTAYTQRFQELILLCTRMVPGEENRVERFIGGLLDNIHGNVIAANPARLQDAISYSEPIVDKKAPGRPGHVKRECPKLRNQNHGNRVGNKTGNQTGGNEATARAYAIGGGGTNPDSNVSRKRISSQIIVCFRDILFVATYRMIRSSDRSIDLMPVRTRYFDIINRYRICFGEEPRLIICDEKVVCIPYGDEVLITEGDNVRRTYIKKLRISPEENRLEDVGNVREFLSTEPRIDRAPAENAKEIVPLNCKTSTEDHKT